VVRTETDMSTQLHQFGARMNPRQPNADVTGPGPMDLEHDAQRIAYIRANDPEVGKYRLLSTNLDGSDEKILDIESDSTPPVALAWSPEGKEIAYSRSRPDRVLSGLDIFDLTSRKRICWSIRRIGDS
jgi:hypothetical protein